MHAQITPYRRICDPSPQWSIRICDPNKKGDNNKFMNCG